MKAFAVEHLKMSKYPEIIFSSVSEGAGGVFNMKEEAEEEE